MKNFINYFINILKLPVDKRHANSTLMISFYKHRPF